MTWLQNIAVLPDGSCWIFTLIWSYCSNKWWHVGDRGIIMEGYRHWIETVSGCDLRGEKRNLRLLSIVAVPSIICLWCVDSCPVLHVILHAACLFVPSLLPQRTSAASLAPQSTMLCVALGGSWVAASHTQQWCPSTLSSAVCRFVWKLNLTVDSSSNLWLPGTNKRVGQKITWVMVLKLNRLSVTGWANKSSTAVCSLKVCSLSMQGFNLSTTDTAEKWRQV